MELHEYLEEYRTLTLNLMDSIQKGGEVDSLIKKREFILKSIDNHNFDKEEIKKIGNYLNLLELEEELQNIKKRKDENKKANRKLKES
jgi:hypothetical protein